MPARKLILILVFCFSSGLQAEDVYYKNGCILRNVKILESSETYLTVQKHDGNVRTLYQFVVEKIDATPFDPSQKTTLTDCKKERDLTFTSPTERILSAKPVEYPVVKYLPVLDNGKLKFIDSTGMEINIPDAKASYTMADLTVKSVTRVQSVKHSPEPRFREGLVIINRGKPMFTQNLGNNFRCMDYKGNTVFDIACEWLGAFGEGLSPVKIARFFLMFKIGSRWGYVGRDGKILIKPQFDFAGTFSEGLAAVRKKEKYGYIDRMGDFAIKPLFDEAADFSENMACVRFDDKYGYIDRKGKMVIPATFDKGWSFHNGRARVTVNNKFGFIDPNGNYIIEPELDFALDFSQNLACVKWDDKIGYIDPDGTLAIAPQFSNGGSFSEDLAPIEIDRKWGYIDKSGNIIIPLQFQLAYPFVNGLGTVWVTDSPIYINKQGVLIRSVVED